MNLLQVENKIKPRTIYRFYRRSKTKKAERLGSFR